MTRRRHGIGRGAGGSKRLKAVPWVAVVAAMVVFIVVAVAVGAVQARRPVSSEPRREASRRPAVAAAIEATVPVTEPATVEVPDVVGMRGEDAEVILAATGLTVSVQAGGSVESSAEDVGLVVESQEPAAGMLVATHGGVTITVGTSLPRTTSGVIASPKKVTAGFVVCIDPGHQARGDSSPEPIGPGSKKTRPRVTSGATGVKTGIPEYEIVLQIAMNLKARLEAQGITVVMTRTTNDVSMSNSERAAVANKADADLFVRIHGDGNPDKTVAGISTLYPVSNRWTRSFAGKSRRAARSIQSSAVRTTGSIDRGTTARADLAGFNWSEVPCVLVECGFLSNPVEDRLLAGPAHQDKVATGIAEGVVAYLESNDR